MNQIKFGPGVVGRVSTMGIAFFACVGIAVYRIEGAYFIVSLVGLAAVVLIVLVFAAMNFANKNPDLSLLEGANLVKYQEVRMAAKGLPSAPVLPPIPDPTQGSVPKLPGSRDA